MIDFPTPKDAKTLKKWGEKEKLTCIFSEDCHHEFTFDTWHDAATFVNSTRALAGYDTMVDLRKDYIFKDLTLLLEEYGNSPAISHYFVKMIFQKKQTF